MLYDWVILPVFLEKHIKFIGLLLTPSLRMSSFRQVGFESAQVGDELSFLSFGNHSDNVFHDFSIDSDPFFFLLQIFLEVIYWRQE